MKAPRLTDTSLRDGSHAMRHQYTRDQVRAVAQALDASGVQVIEVTHGDGLAGSSIQYGFSRTNEMDLIEEARKAVSRAKIAALLLPGIGTRKELKEAVDRGIQIVRIATQCTEADISEQHFGMAKELGLETVGFLMMSHMRPPEFLAEQARLMECYGADCVYVVDSAGALLPGRSLARQAAQSRRRVTIGGRPVKVIDAHAHCVIPVTDIVQGSPLAKLGGGGGASLIGPQRQECTACLLANQVAWADYRPGGTA